jgi:ABC-type sugar transport system substrate-binding protein
MPTLDQPHFVAMRYGFENEAHKLGIKLTVYDAGGYANVARQIQQIEDARAAKVDALIVVACSADGIVPVVEEVIKDGIPVINVNQMVNTEKVQARVRSDDVEIGRMAGRYLAEKLNGEGGVVMLPGRAGTSVIIMRAQGVKEVLGKYPKIKILAEQYTEMTRAIGMNLMEDFLQAHGNAIKGAYCVGEHLGMGAAQALAAAKRTDVIVAAVDFSKDLEAALRDGRISATVVQQPINMGRYGIRLGKDAVEGKSVPKMTYVPISLITGKEVDTVDRSGFQIPPK